MIHVTTAQAVELLDRAVSTKGAGYRYPQIEGRVCEYVRDDAPSCILGHALSYAGVSIDDLKRLDRVDDEADSSSIRDVRDFAEKEGIFTLDDVALDLFDIAQAKQDNGKHWGLAVSIAKKAVSA